ncbi:MAG: hypothetical protein FWE70_08085 [Oscillospiraceae bacterium]|nr:hypothetical protein [Oscillospiraceae bacterium]
MVKAGIIKRRTALALVALFGLVAVSCGSSMFVGKWVDESDGVVFEFRADNTVDICLVDDSFVLEGKYSIKGDSITLDFTNPIFAESSGFDEMRVMEMKYKKVGASIELSYMDGGEELVMVLTPYGG